MKNYNDIHDKKQRMCAMMDEAYSNGYDTACDDCEIAIEEAYQKGLNHAWECVRRIFDAGSYSKDMNAIFGDDFHYGRIGDILKKYSASEAMAKIKVYEEKKKAEDEEMYRDFEVGDVIEHTNSTDTFRAWITDITVTDKGNTYLSLMYEDGSTTKTLMGDIPWRKTGKKIDLDLKSVLVQIKNASE